MRSNVDLLSRAGDETLADLGWIPDFITDLQSDLSWGLCHVCDLLPTSVANGPSHGQIALEVLCTVSILNLIY